jgi:hypothetical protein
LWLGNSKQKKLQNFFELFFCGQQQQKQKPNRSQIIVTNFLGNETGEKFKNKIKTKSRYLNRYTKMVERRRETELTRRVESICSSFYSSRSKRFQMKKQKDGGF